jgi:molybdopterin adenylyltransferase
MMKPDSVFLPLNIAVLTISDSRTAANDKSGQYLVEQLTNNGHQLVEKTIVPDNIYQIRAQISAWIAQTDLPVILTTGGTGLTGRDITPEAILPLLDKEIPGFGELFRMISYGEIKVQTAAIQSRVFAGVANGTYIFCLPGSMGACRTAWEGILQAQLDSRSRPCNFAELMPRLNET